MLNISFALSFYSIGCSTFSVYTYILTPEATCKESGWTEGSHCEICGEILKTQEAIPALGHDWKETSRKEATSSEDGEIIYICQRKNCGATDIKTLPATGG